jgi:hypothetical protein
MFVASKAAQMVGANAREGDDLIFGEDFLTQFNAHHGRAHLVRC